MLQRQHACTYGASCGQAHTTWTGRILCISWSEGRGGWLAQNSGENNNSGTTRATHSDLLSLNISSHHSQRSHPQQKGEGNGWVETKAR